MRSAAVGTFQSVLQRLAIAAAFAKMALPAIANQVYFPDDQSERRTPADEGFDRSALEAAIRYAQQNEAPRERNCGKCTRKK